MKKQVQAVGYLRVRSFRFSRMVNKSIALLLMVALSLSLLSLTAVPAHASGQVITIIDDNYYPNYVIGNGDQPYGDLTVSEGTYYNRFDDRRLPQATAGNTVIFNYSGRMPSNIIGGWARQAAGDSSPVSATDNTVIINSGNINLENIPQPNFNANIYGGRAEGVDILPASATGNTVVINGGRFGVDAYGAGGGVIVGGEAGARRDLYATGTYDASYNTIEINDGTLLTSMSIIGGAAGGGSFGTGGNAIASNNTININGGTISSLIVGGNVTADGNATHNTINIRGGDIIVATFEGGRVDSTASTGDIKTGNKLNIYGYGKRIVAGQVLSFEEINFYLKGGEDDNSSIRSVYTPVDLDGVTIGLNVEPGTVIEWDVVNLIENVTNLPANYDQIISPPGTGYSFQLESNGYSLVAWVVDAPEEEFPHTITASAGVGGEISPEGDVKVETGGNLTFTVTPNDGFAISTVLVDGVNDPSAVASGSYTFSNVSGDHTIMATFAQTDTQNIVVTWNYNGGTGTPASQSLRPGTAFGTLPTPNARAGFIFSGWFDTRAASGGTQITSSSVVPSENTTYWARWTPQFAQWPGYDEQDIGSGYGSGSGSTPASTPSGTPVSSSISGASSWALDELQLALDAGLLIEAMYGSWTQPTSRLLAAEAIVRLIEVSTGKSVEQIAEERGFDLNNHFSDTSSKYVTFLREAGVTNGVGEDRYDSSGTYTRAQMVTMLWRTATNVFDMDLSGFRLGTDVFTDDIPNWAGTNEAIGWAAQLGITTGVSTTSFDSFGTLQNQQTGVFSFRAFDLAFGG